MAIEAKNLGTIAQPSKLTCRYQFHVDRAAEVWCGTGSGGPDFGDSEGMVGPNPRFELSDGWLTLFPSRGWTQRLPLFCFSGFEQLDDVTELRDLKSFAVYVGEGLQSALRVGDTLSVTRNRAGDFSYRVPILRAGSVSRGDEVGPVGVWKEKERTEVTVRIEDRVFYLVDGEDAQSDQHYVFVARTTQKARGIGFIPPQAICSVGQLGELPKELIRDAALQLAAPKLRIL